MYTIKQMHNLTGITPHTLRIWERRYEGLLKPIRQSNRYRTYTDDDLKVLLNICHELKNGLRIGDLASRGRDVFLKDNSQALTEEVSQDKDSYNKALMVAMLKMSDRAFRLAEEQTVVALGVDDAILKVFIPFLIEVGELWERNAIKVAQEHFATDHVRKRILLEIDKLQKKQTPKQHWLLFLPEGEDHEIGLLVAAYYLAKKNRDVLYFGESLPTKYILESLNIASIDRVLFSLTVWPGDKDFARFEAQLSAIPEHVNIYAAGHAFDEHQPAPDSRIKVIRNFPDFIRGVEVGSL